VRKDKLFAALNTKLRGYYNYYGVRGNLDSLDNFYYHVTRMLYRLLNRRSQRRSYNWAGFAELIKVFKLRRPHICHSFRDPAHAATCEASNFKEPGAVVPHAGICTGAAGQLAVLA
jgi:hypothetical protein